MTNRTTTKQVLFNKPFSLGGFDGVLPAGKYRVDTEESLLVGISFPAYRRVATRIRLHTIPGHPGMTQTLTIEPSDLETALNRDQAFEDVQTS